MTVAMAGRPARPSREMLLVLGLFALMVTVVLILGAATRANRPYDLASRGPDGLVALRLWLEELGYEVGTTGDAVFVLPETADALFVYPNDHPYTADEAATLIEWTRQGRALVVVGPARGDGELGRALGVRQRDQLAAERTDILWQRAPVLTAAPAGLGTIGSARPLDLRDAPDALPVVATDGGDVTVALRRLGAGTVWHLSPRHDLTNLALKDEPQGAIVLAVLRTVPPGGQVVFDTYHRFGPPAAAPRTLYDWLYGTPYGWAALYSALVLFVYLLLQGIRLGPPLRPRLETRRREAAEYVRAMAGLQRRAHAAPAIAAYHKQRLKLGLGRQHQLDSGLDDADFVLALRRRGEHLGPERLEHIANLLTELSGQPGEERLTRLVADVDRVLER